MKSQSGAEDDRTRPGSFTLQAIVGNGTKVALAISGDELARGEFFKMRVRLSIILLLMIATATMSAGHHLRAKDDPPAGEQKTELTPEEEREALEVAARFGERLRATNDFGQIVDEMFVPDFPERLRQAPPNWLPWIFLDKSLTGHASPGELRRFYTASMNFYELYFRLYNAAKSLSLKEQAEKGEVEPKFEEVLSPEVTNVLLGNRTFSELAELSKEEESDGREKEENSNQPAESGDSTPSAEAATEARPDGAKEKTEVGIIKSLAELNDATSTLERAEDLMRQRLAYISVMAQAAARDEEDAHDPSKPNLTSLDEGEFGYPEGTPTIHLDFLPYCLHLVKIDGHLKILSVAIYVD